MIIHHNALVLVADGAKYLLFRNAGDFRQVSLAYDGGGEKDNATTRAQGSDQPGRVFSSIGSARSAVDQTDWHQIEEDRFATVMADMLGQLADAGDYDELVIIAPPKCLAALRKEIAPSVSTRIMAEIAKDLTKHPVAEIGRIMQMVD